MASWVPIVTKALDLHLAERQTTFPRPHEEFGSAESTMLLSLYGLTAATAASGMYSNQRLAAPKRPREEKSTESAGSCEPAAKKSTAHRIALASDRKAKQGKVLLAPTVRRIASGPRAQYYR